jgi:hypothetical protein
VADLRVFTKQYGRKAQRGVEPNARRYDSKVEKRMKTLAPQELGQLLSEGGEQPN